MQSDLERDVHRLKIIVTAMTLLWIATVAVALAPHGDKPHFEEIDVERINIVEADGQLRMVISNRERQHPGVVDGKEMPRPNGRPPGMLFFDHLGNECGGLIFDENGDQGHFVSLTMDKSRQDQTVGIQHLEGDDGSYFAGLRVWDRPNTSLADMVDRYNEVQAMEDEQARADAFQEMQAAGEFGFNRITVGKLRDSSAVISLADPAGRPRLRISVDPEGAPRLEFLDSDGEVIESFPSGANEAPAP
jgi:hypothetical protein